MLLAAEANDRMPVGASIGMALLLVVPGLLIAALGRSAGRGTLRRNWFAGIRTSSSLSSDEAWEACHRAAGRPMTLAGVFPVVLGIPLLLRPSNAWGLVLVLTGIAAMLGLVVWAGVVGNRAARAVQVRTGAAARGRV